MKTPMPHRFRPDHPARIRHPRHRRQNPVPGRCPVARAGFCADLGRSRRAHVAVGYDGRLTSPELEAALVEGLAEGGVDVVRIGRGPTPMLYFAAATLEVDGGLMVTGSHNPPDHNGFKLVLGGKPFFGDAIQKLGAMAARVGDAGRAARPGRAAQRLRRLCRPPGAGLRRHARPQVAWDCGNGATGEVVAALVRSFCRDATCC